MDAPELSIVVPVYNVAPWLPECLESIERQTFTKWECVLVNDGSTDFSGIICDSYAKKDPRFRVIHQQNAGVSAARNAGIEAATAPLLAFIDPDDYITNNYVAVLIEELTRLGADYAAASYCSVMDCGQQRKIYPVSQEHKKREYLGRDSVLNGLRDTMTDGCWGYIFTRELWANARFPEGIDFGEDVAIIPPILARANIAVYVPAAVYYYRIRENSLVRSPLSESRFAKCLYASELMREQLCDISPDRAEKWVLYKLGHDFNAFFQYMRKSTGKSKPESRLLHLCSLYIDSYKIKNSMESGE